jgi:hypothetical protein
VFWLSAEKITHRPPEFIKLPMPVAGHEKKKNPPAMAEEEGSRIEDEGIITR